MVCSLVWQPMPSTRWPVALVAVPVSGAAFGAGTCSGPVGPGDGAGWSVPSVLSEASFSFGVPPPPEAGELPPLTASVMPTATAATTTTAPAPISQRWRRLRRASAALISAIFAAAFDRFLLPLDTASILVYGLRT